MKLNYTPVDSKNIDECYNYLKDKKVIAIDIETTRKFAGKYGKAEGLDPYLSKIVMFQIGDKEQQFIIDYRTTSIQKLLPLLTDKNIVKVGHNIKFEYKHVLHNEKIEINNLYDTMIVEQILYNGWKFKKANILQPDGKVKNYDSFSLEDLIYRYLDSTVDKGTRLEFLSIGKKPFTQKQIEYGAEDILYPLLIREAQLKKIISKDVVKCVNLEMNFIPVIADIEYTGMHFDQSIWATTYIKNKRHLDNLIIKLDNFVKDNYFHTDFVDKQGDLFNPGFKCRISWRSPKQVIEFFVFLGICPREVSESTGKLVFTVNAKVIQTSLNTFNKDIPDKLKDLIHLYVEYKEISQACSTFGLAFFKYVNPITKRLHSNYRQILTTGRISSSGPNLQNIPAREEFRGAFTAPLGCKIVNADYSGQEQIILANKSQDEDLIYFYNQGYSDMHSFIASKIYKRPFEDYLATNKAKDELKNGGPPLTDLQKLMLKERGIAKAAGFAINYGGNGNTIASNLGIPEQEGEFVYNAYFEAFPGLRNYFKKTQKEALKKGYILIDPVNGRKYWFHSPKNNKERGKIERLALNAPIQGEAGSITKLASIFYSIWIKKNIMNDKIKITNVVHDEINVEASDEFTAIAAEQLEIAMEDAGKIWCKIIPLKADAAINDYWTH